MADLMQKAIKRRAGRPHKAERMNLLVDDIEDVAEAAKLKFSCPAACGNCTSTTRAMSRWR